MTDVYNIHVILTQSIYIIRNGKILMTEQNRFVFRLDALALSVIATATWLGGWLAGCHTPVLYQNR